MVYCGYGVYDVVGEVVADFEYLSLVFTRLGPDLVRLVARVGNGEVPLGLLNVPAGRSVEVLPHPPVGGGVRVDYLMIRLAEEVSMLPGESAVLDQQVPVDLVVRVGGVPLRVVPVKAKYALYGPPDLGVLCRYSSTTLIQGLPECLRARVRVRISNSDKEVVRMSRVVIPVGSLGLYLPPTKQPVTSSVRVVVHGPTYAEVTTELMPSADVGDGVRPVVEPSTSTFIMRFGL